MTFHLADVTMFMSPSGGGVRRYLEEKRRWLMRHEGWRHTIVAPVDSIEDTLVVPALPLPFSNGYRFVVRRAACAQMVEKLRPDIIEAGDPYRLAWASLDAGIRLDIPTVAFCHSNLEEMAGMTLGTLASRSVRAYLARLYSRFDMVLAPSEWMCRRLADAGIGRVLRQPLGVDTKTFHPLRRDPQWRTGLGLDADARVLIYAGRFAPEKHLDVLCDAIRRLGEPYYLVLIGAGPLHPQGERVLRFDFQADPKKLARCLASADAFVHAGNQETFGLSALEAMACGTPVIARNAAGLAELMDSSIGIPVHGSGPADFASAIASLYRRSSAEHLLMKRNARRRAEQHEWNVIFMQLTRRYRRLLMRNRARLWTERCFSPPRSLEPEYPDHERQR